MNSIIFFGRTFSTSILSLFYSPNYQKTNHLSFKVQTVLDQKEDVKNLNKAS